ncbi:hypothetical protein [Amycolatopsis sp. GM8]|uniref:hypothetical protein n=1 Tax=Amycolatopsis sp. GM8 TaxID=2896530 RepID=UPI001F45A28C|nr:hypothetical protein [Amycolatopsis sp. GM8]
MTKKRDNSKDRNQDLDKGLGKRMFSGIVTAAQDRAREEQSAYYQVRGMEPPNQNDNNR